MILRSRLFFLVLFFFGISCFNFSFAANNQKNHTTEKRVDCHPKINPQQDNYIIGYGSLMNESSRSRTNPDVKNLTPIKINGFIRDWNAGSELYRIIYVGATQCDIKQKNCFLNGLAYLSPDIAATDQREGIYCRKEVPYQNIRAYLPKTHIDPKAKYWIYVTKPEDAYHPDEQHPLIQSYVDLFIGGCIEQAASIHHKAVAQLTYPDDYEFVFDCVHGTNGWTTDYWLNDRVYPDRPWAMSPYALQIDKVLEASYKDHSIPGKYDYLHIPLE